MQRFVLAEMLKVSQMDVGVLVDFLKNCGVQPDWLSMQLPGGTSPPVSPPTLPQARNPSREEIRAADQPLLQAAT